METQLSPLEIKLQLSQCSGSATVSQHFSSSFVYTEGVFLMAEWCKAYWLLDDVGIQAVSLLDTSYFIRIELLRQDHGCTVCFTDGNGNILFQREYRYTDFPLDSIVFYFIDRTLLLPSEY